MDIFVEFMQHLDKIDKIERIDKKIFSALFFSIFAAVTGIGIVVPLLPVYAHDLGASGLYIALIFGGFSISRTIFLPMFGRWSDKKGRKPFLTVGLFFYFIISLAFIFARDLNSLVKWSSLHCPQWARTRYAVYRSTLTRSVA